MARNPGRRARLRAGLPRVAGVVVEGGEEFRARLEGVERRVYRAGLKAVATRTRREQQKIRDLVDAAFPGSQRTSNNRRRVANTIRAIVYDNGSRGAAGLVYSKFGHGKGAGFVDYVLPRLLGTTITARRDKFMVIPLVKDAPALRHLGGFVKDFDRVPTKSGGFLLIKRSTGVPTYVLVKRVKFAARISRANLLAGTAFDFGDELIAAYRAEARETLA